jgi:hypothetical protein
MSNKGVYTEKNIQKLIRSGLKEENRLDTRHKEVVLDLLLQKLGQYKKENQPGSLSIIGLSGLWLAAVILAFTAANDSLYLLDLLKVALSINLLLIPVSSIVIIISKLRTHEKRMV